MEGHTHGEYSIIMMGPSGGGYKKKKRGEGKGLGTKIKGKENTKENGEIIFGDSDQAWSLKGTSWL